MARVSLGRIHGRNHFAHDSPHLVSLAFIPKLQLSLDRLPGAPIDIFQIALMTSALRIGNFEHCKPSSAGSIVGVAERYVSYLVIVVDEAAKG